MAAAYSSILNDPALHRDPPSLLYHYTSPEGLRGMVESGRVWGTHARFMNDRRELDYGNGLLRAALLSHRENEGNTVAAFLDSAVAMLDRLSSKVQVFSFCLSERGDLLSQWRGYGAGGAGYSLGFNLHHLPRDEDTAQEKGVPRLFPVIYDPQAQLKVINNAIEEAVAYFRGKESTKFTPGAQGLGQWIASDLSVVGLMFKDSSFAEEAEWRAVEVRLPGQRPSPLRFRTGRTHLVPFVEMPLVWDSSELPLREVIVGPQVDFASAEAAIRLLEEEIHEREKGRLTRPLKLVRSSIPFRSL